MKVQVNGPLAKSRGSKPEFVPGETPRRQPARKSVPHILIIGEYAGVWTFTQEQGELTGVSTWRKPPTTSRKFIATLLQVKIHRSNRGSNPHPLTMMITKFHWSERSGSKPTELLAAANVTELVIELQVIPPTLET